MTHWTDALVKLKACHGAVEWSSTQPDLATAWRECQRGDWMLWLLGKIDRSEPWSDERKPLVQCAVECAAEAEPYEGDDKAGQMVATCRRVALAWTRGEATREDVIAARYAAVAASSAVYAASGYAAVYADAAYAAFYAAFYAAAAAGGGAFTAAAYAAAYAADAAANAAYAADAAAANSADAERDCVLARCADIVRAHYPDPLAIDLVI
jgi:hypothetical protein